MDKDDQDPREKSQKDFIEAMKKMVDEGMAFKMPPQSENKPPKEAPQKENEQKKKILEFAYTPKEIKKYLDRFVIKQEEAKRVLSTAVCDHYHHVKASLSGSPHKNYVKQNILLLGPTGVGKTYLVRCIADMIGVPFVKADATKFSETGYVGGDVEDLIRSLVRQANGDIELAEYGIVYLDEIDKLSAPSNVMGKDVSGSGVQRGLLKIMEETEVPARNPQDIQSQFEMIMNMQRGGKKQKKNTISTKNILFIASGAFTNLEPIIQKRLHADSIGFAQEEKKSIPSTLTFKQCETNDFITYGFEPEFIGRLPVRVSLDSLNEEDLFEILSTSEASILKQYIWNFRAYEIDVHAQEKALWEMAKLAAKEKTGARALSTICERIFRDFKYELPSSSVRNLTITPELVLTPSETLEEVLKEDREKQKKKFISEIAEYEQDFFTSHEIKISFSEDAKEWILKKVITEEFDVKNFLQKKLTNYAYGLDLIRKKMNKDDFTISLTAIKNPNATLDEWIKDSYEK